MLCCYICLLSTTSVVCVFLKGYYKFPACYTNEMCTVLLQPTSNVACVYGFANLCKSVLPTLVPSLWVGSGEEQRETKSFPPYQNQTFSTSEAAPGYIFLRRLVSFSVYLLELTLCQVSHTQFLAYARLFYTPKNAHDLFVTAETLGLMCLIWIYMKVELNIHSSHRLCIRLLTMKLRLMQFASKVFFYHSCLFDSNDWIYVVA